MEQIKKYLILILTFIVIFSVYEELSRLWSECGQLSARLFLFEYPLLILVGSLFYFPTKGNFKKNVIASLAAITPIIAAYILFDSFYYFRHRTFRFSDLHNILTIRDFSPTLLAGIIALTVFSFLPILILFFKDIKDKKSTDPNIAQKVALRFLLIIILFFLIFSPSVISLYQKKTLEFSGWSGNQNIETYGRIASIFYYSQQSANITTRLDMFNHQNSVKNPLAVEVLEKRNVYIIILESFIDPQYIQNVSFTKSPLYEKIPDILGNSSFDVAIAPVYGGGTAQSEFEIFCGVPALAKIDSIEFNVFNGREVNTLVTALKKYGYLAIASIATKENFYNGTLAYKSLGFDQLRLIDKVDIPGEKRKDYIFDGDLLDQNLEYLQTNYLGAKKPFITYILGMYGHMPFERDKTRHPDVLQAYISNKPAYEIEQIANQFYHRTKGIYDFLMKLRAADPSAIVLVIADHLPPVLNGNTHYAMSDKENIFILLDGPTRYQPTEPIHYFEIPYLIMGMLSGHQIKTPNAGELRNMYFNILATGNQQP
ncbi:MAG: sulfatase-like hydrolase/transferase [Patescibacteria group bacterium]|jgi:hypothetical protein